MRNRQNGRALGRPKKPKSSLRRNRMTLLFTDEEWGAIGKAGFSVSGVRALVLKAARRK